MSSEISTEKITPKTSHHLIPQFSDQWHVFFFPIINYQLLCLRNFLNMFIPHLWKTPRYNNSIPYHNKIKQNINMLSEIWSQKNILNPTWSIPRTTVNNIFISQYLITSAKEVMFSPEFVCLSVCVSVSNITRNVVDGFGWHFQEMSAMGPGTSDLILGVIRLR